MRLKYGRYRAGNRRPAAGFVHAGKLLGPGDDKGSGWRTGVWLRYAGRGGWVALDTYQPGMQAFIGGGYRGQAKQRLHLAWYLAKVVADVLAGGQLHVRLDGSEPSSASTSAAQ